jgi:hypothetical protein
VILNYIFSTRPVMSAGEIAIPAAQQAGIIVAEGGAVTCVTTGGWLIDAEGQGIYTDMNITGDVLRQEITAPNGSTVTQVRVYVKGSQATKPVTSMVLNVWAYDAATNTATNTGVTDNAPNGTGANEYGAEHVISTGTISLPINRSGGNRYFLTVNGDFGGTAGVGQFYGSDRTTVMSTIGAPT